MTKGATYKIPEHLMGKDVWVKVPKWRDSGKFTLSNKSTQRELRHLYTAGIEIENIGEDTSDK